MQMTYLIALSEKLFAACSRLRLSWVNFGILGAFWGFPTLTVIGLPPVFRLIVPPPVETPASEHIDLSTLLVILPLVLPELDLTKPAKFVCFLVFVHGW